MKHIIELRKAHAVVRRFSGHCSLRLPELMSMHSDGRTKVLTVIFAGRNEDNTKDDVVCLAVNTFWEGQTCFLPEALHARKLKVEADTSGRYLPENIPDPEHPVLVDGTQIAMEPRSVLVLSLA